MDFLGTCKTSIIKFVPDPIKDESINIGVVLHCPKNRHIDCKFAEGKLQKIKVLYPQTNLKFLENIISDLEYKYSNNTKEGFRYFDKDVDDPTLLEKISQTFVNQIKFTKPRGLLYEDFNLELENLFKQFVGEDLKTTKKRVIKDITIRSNLKREFISRGIFEKTVIPNARVTGQYGEEIELDFYYKNGKPNYVQSISFDVEDKDINSAKVWLMDCNEVNRFHKNNVGITTVYCPPAEDYRLKDFDKTLKVLKATNTNLVDYSEPKQLIQLIDHVVTVAHN